MLLPKPYTWVELSRSAFNHNVALYKKIIGNTYFAAVVKANAYGHGLLEIGQLCEENNNVDLLCTSHLSEALELRQQGITKPLLVLSVIDEDPSLAFEQDIQLTIFDLTTLNELNALGTRLKKNCTIHIKIDTGMSRFGFLPDEALEQIIYAHNLPNITVAGLYTHCSEPSNSDFTRSQLTAFGAVCQQAEQAGISITYKHATNSAVTGAFFRDYPWLTTARIGAGIYGFWHSEENKKSVTVLEPTATLKPVLSWKTRIMHIRHIQPGVGVGYDRTFQTTRPTRLALLPTGYKESYDRKLPTAQRHVYIDGKASPIVGRTCMNATFIDITDRPTLCEGDIITLIGPYPRITASALAHLVGSKNPREITTALDPTIQRIIVS